MAELVDMKPLGTAQPLSTSRAVLADNEVAPPTESDLDKDEEFLAWPLPPHVIEDAASNPEALVREKKRFIHQASLQHQTRIVVKNVIVVCVTFLLICTALFSSTELRYSLKETSKIFNITEMSIIFCSTIFGLLFFAPLSVIKFGCKKTMVVGFVTVFLYMCANFYVHWGTIMPTAALMGIGLSFLWTAHGVYLTGAGGVMAELAGSTLTDQAVNALFGCFFMVYCTGHVWSALMSAFILQENSDVTEFVTDCGAFYCPTQTDNFTATFRPDIIKLYTLRGTHGLLCVLALVTICLCLSENGGNKVKGDDPNYPEKDVIEVKDDVIGEISSDKFRCQEVLLFATVYQLRRREQLFLVPLTLYGGSQQAFFAWDISQSYVNCSAGLWMVSMTTICWSVATALSSVLLGRLVRLTGRIPIFVAGALVQCGVLLALFLWKPHIDQLPLLFVVCGLWGVSEAVWQCLFNGLYASVFRDDGIEAAFANYHLWRILGFVAAYVYGHFLCTYIKIFTLLCMLSIGMVGYFGVEVPIYRRNRS